MRKALVASLLGLAVLAGCGGSAGDGPAAETTTPRSETAIPAPGASAPHPDTPGSGTPGSGAPGSGTSGPGAPGPDNPGPGSPGSGAPGGNGKIGDGLPPREAVAQPAELRGFAEDGVLALDVFAVREEDGTYRGTATLTNKGERYVDLLFDCGALLRLDWPGRPSAPAPERICPAVHSQGLPGRSTEELTFTFGSDVLAGAGNLAVVVVYESAGNGQAQHKLRAVLEPAGEN